MRRDLYQTLGVSPRAPEEQIKKAFRRVALLYHPDRNLDDPQAEDRFKEANYAYSVLGNPEKRGRYDFFREFRVNAERLGFPSSRNSDQLLEDLFLNTPFPGFGRGFPVNAERLGRLRPLFSFSRTSLLFAIRFYRELKNDPSKRTKPGRRPGFLRMAFRSRGERMQERWQARAGSADSEFPQRGGREARPADSAHPTETGTADLEWVLPLSREEATEGTWLSVSIPQNSGWERLRLRVPAGSQERSLLRLRHKGNCVAGTGERGDLYFRIQIRE